MSIPTLSQRLTLFAVWLLFFSLFSSASGIAAGTTVLALVGIPLFWKRLKEVPRLPLFWPIVTLTAVIALSIAFARGQGYAKSMLKMKYFAIYFLLVLTFSTFSGLKTRLARAAVGLSIFLAVIAVLQFFGLFDPVTALHLMQVQLAEFSGSHGRFFHARGLVYHHNPFAFGALLLYHLLLGQALTTSEKKERSWYWAGVVGALVGILASGSRGAWLALVASSVVLLVAYGRKHWRAFLTIAVVGAVVALSLGKALEHRLETMRPSENHERLRLWTICVEMFEHSPILGVGYHHGFEVEREAYMTPEEKQNPFFPTDPHSVYFDMLGTTGILGFAVFLWLIVAALTLYFRALARPGISASDRGFLLTGLGAWICFAIGAAFDSHFFHTETLNATLFFLGLGQSVVYQRQTQSREASSTKPLGLSFAPADTLPSA